MAKLDEKAMQDFRAQVRGDLIRPVDGTLYEEARKVYNGMIDRRPAIIVRCVNVADVIASVNFARNQKLALAVRGGGHSGPGLCTVDEGLVIDLSQRRGIRVDPEARTVRVEGGARWGDVDHATHPFGLATPSGFISTTGVGGLTLGGGIGYMSRTHGLTIDNLLSVDMVLADGRLVHANAKENKDLFWAVRGGGGNFGVVTAFEYRLHPISQVYGGPMIWPLEKSGEVLRWWRDFILKAPEDINGWFGFLNVPPAAPFPEAYHGKKAVGIVWCYSGPMEKAEERFKPIRAFGPPAIDFVGQVPWPALQSMFDALYPAGLQWYWKADFFKELTDKAIDLHVKHGSQLPSFHSTMHLYPINGAAHRPASGDTAFSFRDAHFAQVIVGVDPDPANNPKLTEWAKNYWLALHPHSAGGAYVNMIMDEGEETVKSAYRDNYPRLAEIKAKYDPGNLFRSNQNIKPSR